MKTSTLPKRIEIMKRIRNNYCERAQFIFTDTSVTILFNNTWDTENLVMDYGIKHDFRVSSFRVVLSLDQFDKL